MQPIIVAIMLVVLHGPTGQRVDINPDKIASIREPASLNQGHWAAGVHCIIVMGNGRIIAVGEECAAVRRQLGIAEKPCIFVCGETPKR